MTDTKEQQTVLQDPKCSKRHVLLVEDCPYCASVRAFLERRVLNAAHKYVAAGRSFGSSSPAGAELISAVDRLESPEADPAPPTFEKISTATGLEYSSKGGKKA